MVEVTIGHLRVFSFLFANFRLTQLKLSFTPK